MSTPTPSERIASSLYGANIGVWDWQAQGGLSNVSPSWSAMLGYAFGELDVSANAWLALIHPEDRKEMLSKVFRQASRTDDAQFEVEYRMRHKAGHWIWIQTHGKVFALGADGSASHVAGISLDVTERRNADTALLEAHAVALANEVRFRSLTELSSDWYWEQDEQLCFVEFAGNRDNPIHLYRGVYGTRRWDIPALNMTEADWDVHRAVLAARQTFRDLEILRTDPKGNLVWTSISGTAIFGFNGEFQGYRGVGRDITAQKKADETIRELAFFDPLTGLPNRANLCDRLKDAVATCRRSPHHAALLFIDLDNFKLLNDTKGHHTGDLLLQQVGQRLKKCVREIDTVGRLGGDEFVVILKALSPQSGQAGVQAKQVGQKILTELNEIYHLNGFDHHCTPSIGAVVFGAPDADVVKLLQRADTAMYQAKADGRNLLRFFDPAMQATVARRNALEVELRMALAANEICVHYQSIVNIAQQVIGYEALARWAHPSRGLIMPSEFIPLAEDSGLILPLGAFVLREACNQLARWAQNDATATYTVAVNVSARQFRQRDFVAVVSDILKETGAKPALLKLELTESLLLNDLPDVVAKMNPLKQLGIGFSLDDFGTGYSSMSYLKSLPLSQLKIDKTFVRDVLTEPSDAAIAISILTLAQALNLEVVAEGVETEGQMAFLAKNGCQAFQGYLFGRPGVLRAN